jgi:hypothetical protein
MTKTCWTRILFASILLLVLGGCGTMLVPAEADAQSAFPAENED